MKKVFFLFAAAAIACSARAANVATFEVTANDFFNATGGAGSLQVVANPLQTELNSTDSCLLNTRPEGQGWNVLGHLYSSSGDSVVINEANRYLHFLSYSPSYAASGKIIVRTSSVPATDGDGNLTYGEDGDHQIQFDITDSWKDVVLDLQGFGNAVYGIYFLSQDWGGSPAGGRTFYYDEFALTNSPTPRGAITEAATLGDFEANGVAPSFAIEAAVLSTLEVAVNPDKTGINASDSALHALTINADGDWWGGLRLTPTNVQVNEKTRYLHVMIYTNLPVYEFDLFSSKGEDWMGKTEDNTTFNTWFDHVVDLYSKDLEGETLSSFRISTCMNVSENQRGKDLYIDEIVVNGDPAPRVPVVTISDITPSSVIVTKGDQLQFTATVKAAYGATDGVTWSVTGGASAATAITANGLLTVANDETAKTLTITITSTYDNTVNASIAARRGDPISGSEIASFEATDAFDDVNGTWSPLEVAENPDKTGINTTNSCLLNTRTTGWTEGGQLSGTLGDFITGGAGRYLHVMVYSPEVVTGMFYIRTSRQDDQWANGSNDIRFDFQPAWKDVVVDLRNMSAVFGVYFLSQDWGGTSTTRYFYYDEIVVNDDPTPRGESLTTASGTVGDFEEGGASLGYTIEGSALATLDVVDNPDKSGVNTTAKALYGLSSTSGESWGGARLSLGNMLVSDETRYLHVLIKTDVPSYEFDFFPMAGEGGEKYAGESTTPNLSAWFDHVVDLYDVAGEKSFQNHVLIALRVVVNVTKEENQGKDLYLDEIVFNSDPTPRAPSVTISGITPAGPSVAKGATLQLTANVTTTCGADSTVTWSVAGGVNMTGITAGGLLSVAAAETADSLTVTATSVYDNTQSATTTVTVTSAATAAEKTTGAPTLSAYPNPTTGVVYVENNGNSEVALYDIGGKLLLRTAGSAIDLSALPGGVYVVKVGGKTAKVVKQ